MMDQQKDLLEQKAINQQQAQTIQQLKKAFRNQNKQLQLLLERKQPLIKVSNVTRCALLRL